MKKAAMLVGLTFIVNGSLALLFLSSGWRGLLQKGLAFLGFRRASAFMGLVLCLWHVSGILQGHGDPTCRLVAVLMMTLWSGCRDR